MWLLLGCLCTLSVTAARSDISVMVVGNSLTFTGDVPIKLQSLLQIAAGKDAKVRVEDYAVPSTNLSVSSDAMMDPTSTMYRLIRQPWDVVVLQEQSQLPGRWLETTTDPSADAVVSATEDLYRLVNISLPLNASGTTPAARQDFQWLVRVLCLCPQNITLPAGESGSHADAGSGSHAAVQGTRAALRDVGVSPGRPPKPSHLS